MQDAQKTRSAARLFTAIQYYFESDTGLIKSLLKINAAETDPAFFAVLQTLIHKLENGASFSEALAQYPEYFDAAVVHMVNNAELRGHPERIIPVVISYYKALE